MIANPYPLVGVYFGMITVFIPTAKYLKGDPMHQIHLVIAVGIGGTVLFSAVAFMLHRLGRKTLDV